MVVFSKLRASLAAGFALVAVTAPAFADLGANCTVAGRNQLLAVQFSFGFAPQ